MKSSLTCYNYVFVNIFSLPFSEQWNEAYSAQCYAVIDQRHNYPRSQCLRYSCVMCHMSTAWPTHPCGEKHQVFIIYKKVTLCPAHNTSHSAGLSFPLCLRARGVCIARRGAAWWDGWLARPRDPDPGAAAATNGRQHWARAHSGGGEGWNVENFYLRLLHTDGWRGENVRMILFCPFYYRVLISAVWSDMFPKNIFVQVN